MRAPKTSNSGTKMLFPIDQYNKKAELSNVIKNEGLDEPSLAMNLSEKFALSFNHGKVLRPWS